LSARGRPQVTADREGGSQLFAVMSRPTDQWRDDPSLLAAHVSFLQNLERRGVTFLSGPLGVDDTGWRGHGLTVIRAGSIAEAKELLATEPFIAAGLRVYDVMPWLITSGRITASMRVSDADSSIR
jgi:uncharacterized protein YciI